MFNLGDLVEAKYEIYHLGVNIPKGFVSKVEAVSGVNIMIDAYSGIWINAAYFNKVIPVQEAAEPTCHIVKSSVGFTEFLYCRTHDDEADGILYCRKKKSKPPEVAPWPSQD